MSLFGFWKPKCPVDFREKTWCETRMRWLGEQFGMKRLTQCRVILPGEMIFSESFDSTPEAAQRLFEQICRFMEVNPSEVELKFETPEVMMGKVGLYESNTVHIVETQLDNPVALTSTMVHELAIHVLAKRNLLDGEEDMEWTTELLPIVFGLGVFGANTTVFNYYDGAFRRGYLSSRLLGYALALHAWLCIERTPKWNEHLRQDAVDAFDRGLKYLQSTEDSLVRIDNLHHYDSNPSTSQLIDTLKEKAVSKSISSLWQLADRGEEAGEAAEVVARLLTDRQPILRAEAARTLARLGQAAESTVPQLIDRLIDADVEVRACSAYALGVLQSQPETTIPALMDCLDDHDIKETVAWSLARFGESAAPAMPRLLSALKDAMGRHNPAMDFFYHAVRAISTSPDEEISRLIASCDSDLQLQAEGILPDVDGEIPFPPGGRSWLNWPRRAS